MPTKIDDQPITMFKLLKVLRPSEYQLTHLELAFALGRYKLSGRPEDGKLPSVRFQALCRYLQARGNVLDLIPDMPTAQQMYDKIVDLVENSYLEERWRKLFTNSKTGEPFVSQTLFGLLFGNSSSSGYSWLNTHSVPRDSTLRLWWFLLRDLEENGVKGFEFFLEVIDAQARAQGFANLEQVVANKSWNLKKDKEKKAKKKKA